MQIPISFSAASRKSTEAIKKWIRKFAHRHSFIFLLALSHFQCQLLHNDLKWGIKEHYANTSIVVHRDLSHGGLGVRATKTATEGLKKTNKKAITRSRMVARWAEIDATDEPKIRDTRLTINVIAHGVMIHQEQADNEMHSIDAVSNHTTYCIFVT